MPRGISEGMPNTTTPHALAAGDDVGGGVDPVQFSEMVGGSEMAKAAATFLTNGVAINTERGRSASCESRGKHCSDASYDSSETDVAETAYMTSSSRSSGGSSVGTLCLAPSSAQEASYHGGGGGGSSSSQEQEDQDASPSIGNGGSSSGAAESCASSSVSPSSSSSSSSSFSSSSSCFFRGRSGVSGVDMDSLVVPLLVDQTATSIEPVSPAGEDEASASSSSEDTACNQTKSGRVGRGRRPSSLLEEQHQQQQEEDEEEECVGGFSEDASSGGSGTRSGIRMAECRVVSSGDSIGSSATLLVGAPEPHALNDVQPDLLSRSDSNQELWGYWSSYHQGGRSRSRSRDSSVSTASYGADDEEHSSRYRPSPTNDHQPDDPSSALLLHDQWLSLQGYSPVRRGQQTEEEESDDDGDGLVVGTGCSAAPQRNARCPPLSDVTPQDSPVLKVVDTNIGQLVGTASGGSGGGGGSSGSKRTPEELAYLRRAGIENFDSNASSVEHAFVGTALRLAAMKMSASTKTLDEAAEGEGHEPPPSMDPLGTPDTDTAAEPPAAARAEQPAAASPPPSPSPQPEDSASFLYSWPDGDQDAAAPSAPSAPFFGVAEEVVGVSDVNDGGEDGSSGVATLEGLTRGDVRPMEETAVSRSPACSSERPDNSGTGSSRSCGYSGSNSGSGGSDYAGSSRSLGSGGRAGGGSRRGSSCLYRQEGGVWIDVDGTPMGESQ